MNTQTITQSSLRPVVKTPAAKINYADVTRGAAMSGLRATVLLETQVLKEFAELDPALGHNTTGVVLAVLLHHLAGGNGGGDDRLTVCLARKIDGRNVEVDLMLLRRRQEGAERLYLRVAGIRELTESANV